VYLGEREQKSITGKRNYLVLALFKALLWQEKPIQNESIVEERLLVHESKRAAKVIGSDLPHNDFAR
jgi:hypothetical protein